MTPSAATLLGLCVALGIGLLIGTERERRKDAGPTRSAAGIRTFAVVALLGAVSMLLEGKLLLLGVTLVVGAGAWVAYQRSRDEDPGITTELALVLTCLLGGLAIRDALLAAGLGVVVVLLLAARNRIHHFVRSVLSEQELHDIILFAALALIVLPLAPDRFLGPFDAINPRSMTRLVVLVMAISAAGYIAVRSLGPRYGLALAGFASGFVSSTATIYSMGERASQQASLLPGAVAAATLSSIATFVQLSIVIALVQPTLLVLLTLPMSLGGLAAGVYGLIFFFKRESDSGQVQTKELGRAFDLKTAAQFAILVGLVLLIAGGLNAWLGAKGLLLSAAITGMVDAHATAASAASLAAASKIANAEAVRPILLGLTTNTLMKALVAFKAGGTRYAARIVPGLVLMIAAVWLGVFIANWI